jgi:hypothetical protein
MPLSDNITIENSEEKEFPVFPEDIYNCKVEDIKEKKEDDGTYGIVFKFKIMDGDFKDKFIFKKVKPKINGAFEGGQPSHLYMIFKATNGEVPEKVNFGVINELIGKNIRVVLEVKKGQKGDYNNAKDFMKFKDNQNQSKLDETELVGEDNLPF